MHPAPAHLLAFLGATFGTPWAAFHEARLLSKGQPLPKTVINWADQHGITQAENCRFLYAHPIPLPAPLIVRRFLDKRGFPCIHLAGLSLRHGIYLAPDLPAEDSILQHELIHTRQYQEAGSHFTFLYRYLFQCLTQGYLDCDMEREARGEF